MSAIYREEKLPSCPSCDSQDIWRSGENSAGRRQWRCKTCGRFFTDRPLLKNEMQQMAVSLLREAVPVPVIARVMENHCSRRWLYDKKKEMNL